MKANRDLESAIQGAGVWFATEPLYEEREKGNKKQQQTHIQQTPAKSSTPHLSFHHSHINTGNVIVAVFHRNTGAHSYHILNRCNAYLS